MMKPAVQAAASQRTPDLPASPKWGGSLAEAALRTLAYGDVFAFPMTDAELHRYLIGLPADRAEIRRLLASGVLDGWASRVGPYMCLRGREALVQVREQRARHTLRLWPAAMFYGRLLAALPFVRLVALTGSLAVGNPRSQEDDLDYLLVTAPGRVWLARLLAIGVVRWAARRGERVCPNYLLSETALASEQQDLYSAHELAQMVPLSGMEVYARLRASNPWAADYLPNAGGPPAAPEARLASSPPRLARMLEKAIPGGLTDRLERWEMDRKAARLAGQAAASLEARFGPDWCKGHFDGHGGRTLAAYTARLAVLGLAYT